MAGYSLTTLFPVSRLAIAMVLLTGYASAGEQPCTNVYTPETAPLEGSDFREIERQVLAEHPILASSPGVKVANIQRHTFRPGRESAYVIWYPHTSNAGVEEALQVSCMREEVEGSWRCEPATIRRYLRLETQEFAVRLLDDTPQKIALAVIEATRSAALATAPESDDAVDTAIMVHPYNEGFLVTWGSREGYTKVGVHAWPGESGDLADASSWLASPHIPEEPYVCEE